MCAVICRRECVTFRRDALADLSFGPRYPDGA